MSKDAKLGLTYLAVAILTFGHAWHNVDAVDSEIKEVGRAAGAMLSSIFWPFYWSVQAWDVK